jgi:hypothetical protein
MQTVVDRILDSTVITQATDLCYLPLYLLSIGLFHVERCFKQNSHDLYQSLVLRTVLRILTSNREGFYIGSLSNKFKFVKNVLGETVNINTKEALVQNFEVRKIQHKSTKRSK